jgi:uncharacterized radical SAM superfamily Fe-S cluster-containing enzyme
MSAARERDYRLLECTTSLCPRCLRAVDAKIVERAGAIFLLKYCPEHGERCDLLEARADYYRDRLRFDKPASRSSVQTAVKRGCPWDCGLCPAHEQHTCIGLVEITTRCAAGCTPCYAKSARPADLSVAQVERMLDFLQEAEGGRAEVVQISGGEPAEHPQVLEILRRAKARGFRFVMLNTNGARLAADAAFAEALAALNPGFEVYLQYDGLTPPVSQALRGTDLSRVRPAALAHCERFRLPVTLVATVAAGVNEAEIGLVLDAAFRGSCVRGVNYQPLAHFRDTRAPDRNDRLTLTGVLERLERQTGGALALRDFVPLPCDVDRVALTYLYRRGRTFHPVTRRVDFSRHLALLPNTVAFDADELVRTAGNLCDGCARQLLADLRPLIPARRGSGAGVVRVSVSSFLDPYNFDMRSMKKECVHVVTPDLRRIPFSAYNMFHRGV